MLPLEADGMKNPFAKPKPTVKGKLSSKLTIFLTQQRDPASAQDLTFFNIAEQVRQSQRDIGKNVRGEPALYKPKGLFDLGNQ